MIESDLLAQMGFSLALAFRLVPFTHKKMPPFPMFKSKIHLELCRIPAFKEAIFNRAV